MGLWIRLAGTARTNKKGVDKLGASARSCRGRLVEHNVPETSTLAKGTLRGRKGFFKEFVHDNAFVLTGQLLLKLQTFFLMPIIIKNAGAGVFGGFVLVQALVHFLAGISSLGVGVHYKRHFPSADSDTRKHLFSAQLLVHLLMAAVLAVLVVIGGSGAQALIFSDEVVFQAWLPGALLFFLVLHTQATNFFRYSGRMPIYTFGTVLAAYLLVAGIGLTLASGAEVTLDRILLLWLVSVALPGIGLTAFIKHDGMLRLTLMSRRAFFTDMRVGFPLVAAFVSTFLLSSSDRFLILHFLSSTSVASYAGAYSVGALLSFVPAVGGVVLPPILSRAVDRGEKLDAEALLNTTLWMLALLAVPFFVGALLLGADVLEVLATPGVAAEGGRVIPIIVMSAYLSGVIIILSNALFVNLETRWLLFVTLLAAVCNVVLNLLLLPLFRDILASAVSGVISYGATLIVLRIVVRKTWRIAIVPEGLPRMIGAALIMGLVVLGLRHPLQEVFGGLLGIISTVFVGLAAYTGALAVLGVRRVSHVKSILAALGRVA